MAEPIRVDLSDLQEGAYALIVRAEDVTHGARLAVERAVRAVEDAEARLEAFGLHRLQRMVASWDLKDADGKPLPAPAELTREQLERIGAIAMRRIEKAVNAEWRKVTGADEVDDPNTPPASS